MRIVEIPIPKQIITGAKIVPITFDIVKNHQPVPSHVNCFFTSSDKIPTRSSLKQRSTMIKGVSTIIAHTITSLNPRTITIVIIGTNNAKV